MKNLLKRVVGNFLADGCVTHGAALAFYALFVLVPVPIFVISGAAELVGGEAAQSQVIDVLRALTGEQMAATLAQALATANEFTGDSGAKLFALISLLFGATAFFVELEDTLNSIWDVPATGFQWRSFLRSRFLSFVMVAAAGVTLLVLTVAVTVARGVEERIEVLLPSLAPALGVGGLVGSLALIWVLFCLIFRYVPATRVSFREVWLGALGTSLLFVIGNELIGSYLRHVRLATVYGVGGSLVLALLWIYYSALVFFLGAELTRETGKRRVASRATSGRTATGERNE